ATPDQARAEYQRTMTQIRLAQGVAGMCAGYGFNADAAEMLTASAVDLAQREMVRKERLVVLKAEADAQAANALTLQASLGSDGVCAQAPIWLTDGAIDPTLLTSL
ncbi:MAG: hypothetical protein AAGH17_06770, partial [Pseudomonadota bacterium]